MAQQVTVWEDKNGGWHTSEALALRSDLIIDLSAAIPAGQHSVRVAELIADNLQTIKDVVKNYN
jgi:hypothetical protein